MESAPIKPSIVIYVNSHYGQEAKLREVQAGIEEEGIPCAWYVGAGDAGSLAYRGASESQLGVGVGISAEYMSVHSRKLPEETPLFVLADGNNSAAWRRLGCNAARLVKGTPFKELVAGKAGRDDDDIRNWLAAVIREIIEQKQLNGHGR